MTMTQALNYLYSQSLLATLVLNCLGSSWTPNCLFNPEDPILTSPTGCPPCRHPLCLGETTLGMRGTLCEPKRNSKKEEAFLVNIKWIEMRVLQLHQEKNGQNCISSTSTPVCIGGCSLTPSHHLSSQTCSGCRNLKCFTKKQTPTSRSTTNHKREDGTHTHTQEECTNPFIREPVLLLFCSDSFDMGGTFCIYGGVKMRVERLSLSL